MASFTEKYGKQKRANAEQKFERIDYSALKQERLRDVLKCTENGKTSIVILCEEGNDDPFVQWGFHKSLQEVDYFTVPCDAINKEDAPCAVCDKIQELINDDPKGNEIFYGPINQKTDNYARVVLVDENNKYGNKAYWFRVPVSITNSLVNVMRNLEEDEYPFYDREHPSKLVIEYDPKAPAATQYNVVVKPMKNAMNGKKIDELISEMKPLSYYTPSRRYEGLSELVDTYIVRKLDEVEKIADQN